MKLLYLMIERLKMYNFCFFSIYRASGFKPIFSGFLRMNHQFYFTRIMKSILASFLVFFCFNSFGEQKNFPVQSVKLIDVKAMDLEIKVKKHSLKVYTINWSEDLSFKDQDGALTFQSEDFFKGEKKGASKSILEIKGPGLPVSIFTLSVKASFVNWTNPVFLSSFEGDIKGSNNRGLWEISMKKGRLNLHRQKGALSLKGFHIDSFITSSEGDFKFQINEGRLKMKKCKGKLDFTTDSAKIELTGFEGSLNGFSQTGPFSGSIKPDKVNLFVAESPLRIYFMGQATKVKAYTERGKIYAPKFFYKKFSGRSTEVLGRTKGSRKKGEALLKSDTGTIYIN